VKIAGQPPHHASWRSMTMRLPSGENCTAWSSDWPATGWVTWCRPEPSGWSSQIATRISPLPPSVDIENAIQRPSGDQAGDSIVGVVVAMTWAFEPSAFITYSSSVPQSSPHDVVRVNAIRAPSGDQLPIASTTLSAGNVIWVSAVPSGLMTNRALLVWSGSPKRRNAIKPFCPGVVAEADAGRIVSRSATPVRPVTTRWAW
jgi:hypothetical protein